MRHNRIENLEPRTLLSTIRVDVNSPASNPTGTTWALAYQDLQQALAAATFGDEIWVADGTYKPTTTVNRTISFQLKDGVKVYGGYAGNDAPVDDPDARDIAAYPAILSGDIGAIGAATDNSYNVVVCDSVTATIDGFTIRDGRADADEDSSHPYSLRGPGLESAFSDITIRNCRFISNQTNAFAACNLDTSDSTVTDCTFDNNFWLSTSPWGNYGAALRVQYQADVERCRFSNNSGVLGGGIFVVFCTATIANCEFVQNSAQQGGALNIESASNVEVSNCTFSANYSKTQGGAIRIRTSGIAGGGDSHATIVNSTFIGNRATDTAGSNRFGGAIYTAVPMSAINCDFVANSASVAGGAIYSTAASFNLSNSVVRGNDAPSSPQLSGVFNATSSNVQGGFAGAGNIDADPQFVRNPFPGADSTWGTADDDYGDLLLQITSPCIDAGNNTSVPSGLTTDLAGNTRFYDFPGVNDPGAIVDMGAYELTNHLPLLKVAANQTLALPAGHHIFVVDQLQIDPTGTLDVRDNDLLIDNNNLSTIAGMTFSGRAGGAWSGTGITSSSAKNNPALNTTLGVMGDNDYKSIYGPDAKFDGETIDNGAVLIKYTYYGDANFNGRIDGGDYSRLDFGFTNHLTGWVNGDFNGDGVVNGSDYGLIDFAFTTQSSPINPPPPGLPPGVSPSAGFARGGLSRK